MRRGAALALLAALGGCAEAPATNGSAGGAETLVLRQVHVLPMTAETVLRDHTVVVEDGRIAAVGPAGEIEAPAGATVVEGGGRYLLPGLVDFHVHLRDESELASYLAHGVTTVVNLRGSPEHLELAAAVAAGLRLGPTIYTAGPLLDGDPPVFGGAGTVVVESAAEARRAVAEQAAAGYDLVKVYNNLPPEALVAAVEEAHGRGLAVAGHIPRNPDRATALQRALAAGIDLIAHGEEFFFTYLGGAADAAMKAPPPTPSPERIREAARMAGEAEVAVTPNLSFIVMTARMLEDLPAVLEHPEARYLSPEVRAMWKEQNPTHRQDLERFAAREAVKYPAVRTLTRELQRAGVPLLLGTDASAPGLYPGWSALLELEELVAAGLTPFEALVAGTRAPGRFLARHVAGARRIGTIEVGKAADLLLVESNPLEDVGALRERAGIVLRGEWIPGQRLQAARAP